MLMMIVVKFQSGQMRFSSVARQRHRSGGNAVILHRYALAGE